MSKQDKVWKRLVTPCVVAVGLMMIVGSGTAQAQSENISIGAVVRSLSNPYFIKMANGLKARAEKHGISITVQAAKNSSSSIQQANILAAMARQNYDCYVVNPLRATNLIQPLTQIASENKPFVNIDNPISEKAMKAAGISRATYIGTDNVLAGKLAAKAMAHLVPEGSTIALIGGVSGSPTSVARLSGFRQVAKKKGLKIGRVVAGKWKRQVAFKKANYILRANPDLDGFFVANEVMALGVVQAVKNAGEIDDVKIVSVDGSLPGLKSIKHGGLTATVAQYPYVMGLMAIEACLDAMAGKSLPERVDSPIALITSDNVKKALKAYPMPFKDYDSPFSN